MFLATRMPIITPSYIITPWSTTFMNDSNFVVDCGGANILRVVVLMHSTLSWICRLTSALRWRMPAKASLGSMPGLLLASIFVV